MANRISAKLRELRAAPSDFDESAEIENDMRC